MTYPIELCIDLSIIRVDGAITSTHCKNLPSVDEQVEHLKIVRGVIRQINGTIGTLPPVPIEGRFEEVGMLNEQALVCLKRSLLPWQAWLTNAHLYHLGVEAGVNQHRKEASWRVFPTYIGLSVTSLRSVFG